MCLIRFERSRVQRSAPYMPGLLTERPDTVTVRIVVADSVKAMFLASGSYHAAKCIQTRIHRQLGHKNANGGADHA